MRCCTSASCGTRSGRMTYSSRRRKRSFRNTNDEEARSQRSEPLHFIVMLVSVERECIDGIAHLARIQILQSVLDAEDHIAILVGGELRHVDLPVEPKKATHQRVPVIRFPGESD